MICSVSSLVLCRFMYAKHTCLLRRPIWARRGLIYSVLVYSFIVRVSVDDDERLVVFNDSR